MIRTPEIIRIPLRQNATGRGLLLTTLALLAMGVVMVYSALMSVSQGGEWYARVDVRHGLFAILAATVMSLLWALDYNWLARGGRFPIAATVLLGVAVCGAAAILIPGVGHAMGGKVRWLRVGPAKYAIGFQPAELVKLALVIFLSAWLTRPQVQARSFTRTFLPAIALVGVCVGLIIRNDLSSAAIVAAAACGAMFLAGVPWWYFLTLLGPAAGAVWKFVITDPHRWARIQAMIDPWAGGGAAYQSRQSLLAIIGGGWTGKGLGAGVQKLGFLPEDSTDFIFSVFCEEWGFVGAMLLMGLVAMWMWHARRAALRAPNAFGQVLAGSLGLLIAGQAILHIAVDLVAVPPTGVSLPFVSAGGTALVLMAAAVALIVSVSSRRAADGSAL